ncbi:MAG TPA: glycosyltransferase, partial [Phycisphaerae bacterium]|nr:glycosyltransferase [Phycisphaerae bacterium]
MRIWIESILARAAVLLILSATAAACGIARIVGGLRFRPALPGDDDAPARRDVVLVGTFYNDGWLRSHLDPLRRCEAVGRIFVLGRRPIDQGQSDANMETPRGIDASDKVRFVSPSEFASRLLGRTIARFLTLMKLCRRERAAVLMGYHIMPNALMCLVAARWYGLQAAYQMTGGPVQIIGGGVGSENVLLRRQRKPSRLREWLMIHLVRQFDEVIVRGPEAARYVEQIGAGGRCHVVPGGIDTERFAPTAGDARGTPEKLYDLIAVGRLVAVKRYDRLLRIVSEIRRLKPDVRHAIVGDGPLRAEIEGQIRRKGLELNVELLGRRDDVVPILRESRAFILTSENEGLSIAMMEAMAAGLPAIVPDIGELKSVVRDGVEGILIDPAAPGKAAVRIAELLRDGPARVKMAESARAAVCDFASVEAVARRWNAILPPATFGAFKQGETSVRGRSPIPPDLTPAMGRSNRRQTAGIVFGAALAVRLLFCFVAVPLMGLKTGPSQREFFTSTDGYVNIAMNIVEHGTYAFAPDAAPTTYRAPAYPALLAGAYAICRDAGTAVMVVNCVASATTCVVLYLLATQLMERRVSFWMLSPAVFFPLSIYYCASSFSDTVLALFVVVYLYSVLILMTSRAAAQAEPRPSGSGGR